MSIELATKYEPYVDELFSSESKTSLLTNTDFDWTGAKTVKIWKIGTADLNDYSRNRSSADDEEAQLSRFGHILDLDATTEEMMLKNDRSFIFNIDLMDQDETVRALEESTALAREIREVVIPEMDKYVYQTIADGAGTVADPLPLTTENIYPTILTGSEVLDDGEVPDTDRVLVVTPSTYSLLKQSTAFDNTEVGADMKLQGVVGILDGMLVVRVPASRLPEGFGFMIVHPSATVAPVKLEDYGTHDNTPLSSGTIVTGRIVYDAFVMENKKIAIYYQKVEG